MSFDHKWLHGRPGLQGLGVCMVALLFSCSTAFAAPAPQDVLSAHPAVRYDPKDRCPDLRVSDEGDAVAVVFVVNAYGAPSQAHVRAPSGVAGLDAAAVSCVMRIRFQPATRPGDAQPVDSWQQLWLRYATPAHAAAATAPPAAATAVAGTAAVAAGAAAAGVPPAGGTSAVHVCTDAAGRLTQDPVVTHSSGDPALDAAAVRIAKSGAGNYRPAAAAAVSGCAQLSVTFEAP
jgi:TonB family protein